MTASQDIGISIEETPSPRRGRRCAAAALALGCLALNLSSLALAHVGRAPGTKQAITVAAKNVARIPVRRPAVPAAPAAVAVPAPAPAAAPAPMAAAEPAPTLSEMLSERPAAGIVASRVPAVATEAARGAAALAVALPIDPRTPEAPDLADGMQGMTASADARREIRCLALNIYFEARSEPEAGKRAVGHVVMNRVADSRFPDDICKVVEQGGEWPRNRCQFSWWCDGKSDKPRNLVAWAASKAIARQIYSGHSKDPTHGALWYHAEYVAPAWGRVLTRAVKIGRHIFYQEKQAPGVQIATAYGSGATQ